MVVFGALSIQAQIQMPLMGSDNLAGDIQAETGARRFLFRCGAPIEALEDAFTFFLAYRTPVVRDKYSANSPCQFNSTLTSRPRLRVLTGVVE